MGFDYFFFLVYAVHKNCAELISVRYRSVLKGGAPSPALPAGDWGGPAFPMKSLPQVSAATFASCLSDHMATR